MRICILFLFIVIMSSCKGVDSSANQIELTGQWNFNKATRNGKETKTLDSGIFIFEEDSRIVKSNIFQGEKSKSFQVQERIIDIYGENPMQFYISYYAGDSMILTGTMWKFNMEFLLIKQDTIAADSSLYD